MFPANTDLLILAPTGQTTESLTLLDQRSHGRCRPFAQERIEALERISKAILTDKGIGRDPAAVALAFWLRTAHSMAIRDDFIRRQGFDEVMVPTGLVFHIAPSNVDTLFVYSWALSYLSGNANVVRLSSKESNLVTALLGIFDADMKARPESWIGNYFVSYGHDDTATAYFSEICDHRIIWGGDETVAKIRAIALNPHASERAFASKLSIAVIKTESLAAAGVEGVESIAKALASDIVPFDQKACSSPHLVYWLGADAKLSRQLAAKTGQALAERLAKSDGVEDAGMALHRVESAFRLAGDGKLESAHFLLGICLAEASPATQIKELEVGGHFITQRLVSSIDMIASDLGRSSQTITYYGLQQAELLELAWKAGIFGADRLVPLGHALDFDTIWDGFDLLGDFTRKIRCANRQQP
ncbi:MAG: acyl-CoA reductase [Opitutaceae bacterium]|jgi:hypothetical protein